MSRLTNQHYLKRHHFLRHVWLNHPSLFSVLEPYEQWQIHKYYHPSKDWADEELLRHRVAITKQEPSLPARTGKLFHRVERAEVPVRSKSGGKRHVRVSSIVKPQIDTQRLANAVLALAEEMNEAA